MENDDRPLRIAIVEDHTLFRSMLEHLFAEVHDMRIVCSVETATEARARITPGSTDVVILDVDLPDGNGIGLGVLLCRADPALKVVLLSAQDAIDLMLDLPREIAGSWSYLSKTSTNDSDSLVRAVRVAAAGGSTLDPVLLERMRPRAGSRVAQLTDRQYSVLRLLASGLSNAGIAHELGIAEKSVQNHVNAVYSTLGIDAHPDRNPRVSAALQLIEETGPA